MARSVIATTLALLAAPAVAHQLHSGQLKQRSCLGADVLEQNLPKSFDSFIQKFERTYTKGSEEFAERFGLFSRRMNEIETHNCDSPHKWKAQVNTFADRSDQERDRVLGWRRNAKPRGGASHAEGGSSSRNLLRVTTEVKRSSGSFDQMKLLRELRSTNRDELPAEHNWKHLNAMQKVRDQGDCGSCWAFAAGTALSAHAQIAGREHDFSIQQIVSCTQNEHKCGGTGGCDGATAELAMEYVLQNGLTSEEKFKYEAQDTQCPSEMVDKSSSAASSLLSAFNKMRGRDIGGGASAMGMTGWMTLPENELKPLKSALVTMGPVAVSVAADAFWFMYSTGIMKTCNVDKPIINHAVVLVGYGIDNNNDGDAYWELQNSWGKEWGEGGFVRITRVDEKEEKHCGIDDQPEDGIACLDNLPTNVTVCGTCGVLYDSVVPSFVKQGTEVLERIGKRALHREQPVSSSSFVKGATRVLDKSASENLHASQI